MKDCLAALAIITATVVFYLPALHGGFLWDDNTHISDNAALRTFEGLREIWINPAATCQYYPLTFTVFWASYHLWGLSTTGYHFLNVFLHGIVAVMLWQILSRLRVRGALLAGAIFALHPVNVMSVAWMTELKNTLSASLALGSCWAYIRFACLGVYDHRNNSRTATVPAFKWSFYILSLLLFQLAMFAKTAVSFLPVTLLLIVWWQRERLTRRDVLAQLPMLVLAVGMSTLTVYIERHAGGAYGKEFSLGFMERILVSGRSFWFYLGKLVFPLQLSFIYKRWNVDTDVWWQYLYPACTFALLAGLWMAKSRVGKGVCVAFMHFYISTSLLILAVVLYMMRYSFVSDHWQYFGSMSMIALIAAGLSQLWNNLRDKYRPYGTKLAFILLFVLGILTWNQAVIYADNETLWRVTVARNPDSWMPHDNLGNALSQNGKVDEAIEEHSVALRLNPNSAETYSNLANALLQNEQIQDAIVCYKKSLQLNPSNQATHYNLGNLLLFKTNQLDDAISHLETCVEIEKNLTVWPGNFYAHYDLGLACYKANRALEAATHYRKALEIRPDFPPALINLAWMLATCPNVSVRNGSKAVELALKLDQRNPSMLRILAAAYAEAGRFPEAVETAQRAYSVAIMQSDANLAEALLSEIKLYQASTPYRDLTQQ